MFSICVHLWLILSFINLVANSEKMQAIVRVAERVAPTDATVLITGESGTGKNALAEYIHAHSKRADRDLVKIDCAALPKELLEAELFGHERGAFTGAAEARPGKLEAAHKSTLLLDEIALLPIDAQAKLLRVLEQREFERLGGRKIFKIDVRVIATTNVDLENAIKQKRFREDLFFRLNVVRVEVPPLRQRRDDVTTLAQEFLQIYALKHAREKIELSSDALKLLENYDFPGNVRELSNLIERAVLIANEKITAEELPSSLQTAAKNGKNWLTLAELEEQHVSETLALTKNNKSEAAKLLGISRKNLYEKLSRYKLYNSI